MPLNIDWQQILLHLFNFFLLLAILTYFVYEPVLKFIQKRQEHFQEMENDYKEKSSEAQKLINDNKKIFENTDVEIKNYKSKKMEEINLTIQEKLNKANAQADDIIEQAKNKAEAEYTKLVERANKDIRKLAIETTKKLLNSDKDEFDDFISHFQAGDGKNE